MTKNCFSGALASIVDEGSLTLTQATVISAVFYIVYTPFQVVGGVVADKVSPEKMIAISLIGSAATNVVVYFNQNFYVMLVSWAFNGFIQFSIWPSVFKIMSSQLCPEDRPKMIFFMSLASSSGLVLTYLLSAIFKRWQDNFLFSTLILVALAIAMPICCKCADPYVTEDVPVPNKDDTSKKEKSAKKHSTIRVFAACGFFFLLGSVFLRTVVENSVKTFSPTMLMQSYDHVTPSIGNLLTILVVVSGVAGTFVAKALVFPKLIKNEVIAYAVLAAIALVPLSLVLFIGKLPVPLVVIVLCVSAMLMTATHLMTQFYTLRFVPFGKSGTASGVLNAGASFGIVIQNLVLGPVAEHIGWVTVTVVWVIMMALCSLFSLICFVMLRRTSI